MRRAHSPARAKNAHIHRFRAIHAVVSRVLSIPVIDRYNIILPYYYGRGIGISESVFVKIRHKMLYKQVHIGLKVLWNTANTMLS